MAESALHLRLGRLELRLAESASDIRLAQQLRYAIFRAAHAGTAQQPSAEPELDADSFDALCDHLLVFDSSPIEGHPACPQLVGTYRLLRQDVAEAHEGFYSSREFDIPFLVRRWPHRRFLELGRSCVRRDYRNKRVLELLWRGIWAYRRHHGIDVLFGCASLPGIGGGEISAALAYLGTNALAEPCWQAPVRGENVPLSPSTLPEFAAALAHERVLPPLVRGYLRLGARFSDHAAIDRDLGVTDVLAVLPIEWICPRYIAYFGADFAPSSTQPSPAA